MMKSLQIACTGALLGAFLFCSGCVAYGPGPGGYYDYDFYPDVGVYYYPAGGVYYWNHGGYWYHGRHLPHGYALHPEMRQQLHLHTRQPWTEDHSPGGWHH